MELIDQLEQRIEGMLQGMTTLREENRRLKEEVDLGLAALEEENRSLKEELEQERSMREAVLQRVDSLLAKLKDQTDE